MLSDKPSNKFNEKNIQPLLSEIDDIRFKFEGFVGNRIKANENEWLLKAINSNPAMMEIFFMRDRKPPFLIDAWSGEYPGKFLISAIKCWRISRSEKLKSIIIKIVNNLSAVQDCDGYLGPFPKSQRIFGEVKKQRYSSKVWDLWGHYHCMLGLFLWFKEVKDKLSFDICIKAADFLCDLFLNSNHRVYDTGAYEMNMAIIHIFCLLYKETNEPKYLRMVNEIECDWSKKDAGNYLNNALEEIDFFKMPAPRWESLHSIQALAEMYYIKKDKKYKNAFMFIYNSILKNDRHNTGGFSSDEKATGNPYDNGTIETCAVIAWIALSIDMLCLTGEPIIADEIELSTFNAIFGAQSPSGRWWTYNTPMNGQRRAFYHDHNWQCLPGGPELNCCYTNAARGIGMLSDWAIMKSKKGLYINYYGPATFKFLSPSGKKIELIQKTDYPLNGQIIMKIKLEENEKFFLNLRIPKWSKYTKVLINNKDIGKIKPGNYLSIDRIWKNEDEILLFLDMAFHYWLGKNECEGKTSIYYGPILLTYDQRFNKIISKDIPELSMNKLKVESIKWEQEPKPWLVLKFKGNTATDLVLCDFASAGATGTYYESWIKVADLKDYVTYFG